MVIGRNLLTDCEVDIRSVECRVLVSVSSVSVRPFMVGTTVEAPPWKTTTS